MDLSRLSEQDLRAIANNDISSVSEAGLRYLAGAPTPQPKEGIGAAFQGGLEGLLSRARTGVEAIFDPEEAARRGVERGEAISQEFAPGASLQRVKDVYAEQGLFPAAGEVISQIPSALAEQAPNIAATLASAKAGAAAGSRMGGGRGAIVGGAAGALAPSLLQLFGSNIERQAEEGQEISRGAALAAAAPGAALEVASTFIPLGRTIVGKLLGPQAREVMERGTAEAREALAQESLLRVLGKGTAVGAAVEIPTEVTQQMLERLQAGLPITSDDALAEYGEAAYGAGLVGAPFGAAGRAGQRSVARGEIEQEQAKVRAEEARVQAEEARAAEEAEEARKASPEFRQDINAQLVEKKDRLRELEQLLKDKTTDEDVKAEAKAEAKTLRQELGDLNKQMKESMSKAGIAPTVESALKRQKTQIEQKQPIVDDFGNVIQPKTTGLTPEQEAEGYERQAARTLEYFKEREDALERLREFDEREDTARRIVEQELAQNQPFIRRTTAEGKAEPFVAYPSRAESFDPTQARRPKGVAEDVWNASTLEEKAELVKEARIEQYAALLEDPETARALENAQLDTERQKLNLFLTDEATKDQTAEQIAQRRARDEAIVDIAEFQVSKARQQLGLGALFLGPVRQRRIENAVNQGIVDRYVASALEIKGLGNRKLSVADAMPNIRKAIDTLESERRSLTGKDIVNPDGGLTPDGIRLVQVDTKLEEIQRLLTAGATEEATPTEQALTGRVAGAGAAKAKDLYNPKLEKAPTAALENRALKAKKAADGGFLDLISYLDDYRAGRFFGPKGAKRDLTFASSTRAELLKDVEGSRKRIIDNIVDEVATKRAAQKLLPLTRDEAKKLGGAINDRLSELIDRSLALPSGSFLRDEILIPAQMRGTEVVRSAEIKRIDPRNLSERQFAAPEQAVKVIAEEIMQLRDTGQTYTLDPETKKLKLVEVIPSGKRPVRAEKPLLKQQFRTQEAETEYAQTDRVVEEIGRVLAMPDLDPQVAQVLDRAATMIANENVNPTFLNTVDEQVGRILLGIDKPFTPVADSTQPAQRPSAARRAMLINEIQQDMDQELAVRAAAMQDVTTQGDLFAEELATTRATPAQFQRLQKSGKVAKERERIAKEKAETAQTRRVAREAKREVEETLSPQNIETEKRKVLEQIQQLLTKTRAEITEGIEVKKTKSPKYKQFTDELNKLAQDIDAKQLEFEVTSEGTKVTYVSPEILENWVRLDTRIQKAIQNVKDLEARADKAAQGSVEQRKARALAKQQRAAVAAITKKRNDAAEALAKQNRLQQERLASGLGLPGARFERKTPEEIAADLAEARAERKKAIKAVGAKTAEEKAAIKLKRKSKFKIAAIKSAEEIEADRREALQEGMRKFGKAASPKDVEMKAQEEFDAANAAFNKAKKELADFRKTVNEAKGAKDFKKYEKELFAELKRLGTVVDAANVRKRYALDNLNLLSKVNYNPNAVRRQAAQRTVPGVATESQKSYTPEQLADLTGMPANMLPRGTFSVDDTTNFAVGDSRPEVAVDFAEVEKRLKEVKAQAKKMGVEFNYYPSVAEADIAISRAMARQGLDPLTDSVKGGVLPNGDVFVIVDAHADALDLEKTIAHELIGHYSFESMLGKDGMETLMRKVDKSFATKENENGLENLADSLGLRDQYNAAIVGAYNFYKARLEKGDMSEKDILTKAKTDGLREIIAYTMEKRVDQSFMEKAKRWLQELVGAFRSMLKKLGLVDAANMSTSDLFYLMRQANNNFTAGKPMAMMKPDGTVSFRSVAAPTPATGFDAMIAREGKVYDRVKSNVTGLAARVQFFDRLAALDALVKRGVEKGIISSLKAMDVLYFSRMADQRNNFVAQFATSGVGKISLKDGERMYTGGDGPSLKDVSQALSKSGIPSKDIENEFTKYLIAVRANRVGVDKLDFTGQKITQREVNEILAKYSGTDPASTAFKEAQALYRDYNRNLIDFVVSSGAISKEKGKELKDPGDYVPFYRQVGGQVELVVMGEKPIRIGDIKNQPYLQELVGGETAVLPVFTSALQNTSLLVDMALKNMATRNTAYVLRDMGVAQINDYTDKVKANPNIIRFKVEERDKNGELKHKEKYALIDTKAKETLFGDIPTELVVQGMEGIKAVMPAGIRLLGMPANWLRKFVTRDPRYAIRQIFRDSMASVLTTGANFVPVVQTLKDMATMKKSGTLEKLRESGVVGGQVITGASDDMAKILQQVSSGKPGWDMAMAKLDEFAMMGDAATRVSMYNSFLKQGLSDREATFATLEAMNFGRRGLSPTILYANTLIPFFNAGLQGIDVLYRAFKGDMPFSERLRVKQKLLARGGMMAIMTMAYAAAMEDEDEYKNANPDERYNNWFVPTPFGVLRVPIPFEAGLVFKGIPEGVYRMAFTDDKNADVLKALKDLALRSVPGDIPTAIKPLIELNLNKSFFTDREIVDASLPEEAKYQYRPNTPELIKMFGSVGLSPVQVEYFIKGYTGSLLVGTMRMFDPVFGGELVKPDMRITDVPVLGGLFQPKDAGGLINAAYNTAQTAQAAQRTLNRLQQEDPEEAKEYAQKAINNLSLAVFAGQFKQQMGQITQAERSIRASKTMTGDEKRTKLDDLRQQKIKLATQFNNLKAQTERQAARSGLQ